MKDCSPVRIVSGAWFFDRQQGRRGKGRVVSVEEKQAFSLVNRVARRAIAKQNRRNRNHPK